MYTKGNCEIIITLQSQEYVNEAKKIYKYGGIDWAGDKMDIEGVNGNSNDIDISDEDKTMWVNAFWKTGIDFSDYDEQEKEDWIINEIVGVVYDNIRSQTNLKIESVDIENIKIRDTVYASHNNDIEIGDRVIVKEGENEGQEGVVDEKEWDEHYWRDAGGEWVYVVKLDNEGYYEGIEIELADKIESAYKFKTKMAPYLMLDVIGTTTAEKIAYMAKQKYNMPGELYGEIFNKADIIGDKFVAKMTKFFETDEKFNKKLSSTSGEVALNYAYMWAQHWVGKMIEEEVPEAKPYMRQMGNDRYFWDKPLEAKEKKECEQCNDMVNKLTYYDNPKGTDMPGNVCDSCLYMNKLTEIYDTMFDMVFENDYYYGKDYKKLYNSAKTDIEKIAIKFSEMIYEEVKENKDNPEEIMQKMIDGSQPGNYMDENQIMMDAYDFVMGTDSNAKDPFKNKPLEAKANSYTKEYKKNDYILEISKWIKESYGKEAGERLEYFDRNAKAWFDHGVTLEEAKDYIIENFKIKGSEDIVSAKPLKFTCESCGENITTNKCSKCGDYICEDCMESNNLCKECAEETNEIKADMSNLRKQMEDKINKTGEILWDIIEDDMVIEWGFDLSDIKTEDWINILKEIGAKSEAKYDDKNEYFVWKGNGIKIITSNNPITGQPAAKRRDNPENYEKDYAGYVGVRGLKEEVKKFVELFIEYAGIKDMSILRRDFI